MRLRTLATALCLLAFSCSSFRVHAQEGASKTIELADGKIVLPIPKEWKKEEPKSRIVQYEFSAPVAKEGEGEKKEEIKPADLARITIMGAGGGVEANLDRWYTQFEQPGGGSTKEKAKLDKFEAGGQTVHYVDVSGSFKDTMGAGPFSGKPAVLRENYRMLGAIIVTDGLGEYFIKITGPDAVVGELDESFRAMLKELKTR
jgi:hypothetical protein